MQNLEYNKIQQFLVNLFDQDLLSSSCFYLAEPQLYQNLIQDIRYCSFLSFADQYQLEHGKQYVPIYQQQQSLILKEKQEIQKNPYLNSNTYAWIGAKKKQQKTQKSSVNKTKLSSFSNKQVIYQSLQFYGEQQTQRNSRNTSSSKKQQITQIPPKGNGITINNTIKLSNILKTPNFKQIDDKQIIQQDKTNEVNLNSGRDSTLQQQRMLRTRRSFSQSDNLATHQVIINTINEINQLKQKLDVSNKFSSSGKSERKSINDFPQRLSIVPPAQITINVSKYKGS